jgi:hypothetical protein
MSGGRWTIGNGKSILFWPERLVPYGNIVLKSSPAAYSGRVVLTFVHDFVNAEGQSDVNHLMDFIPIWLLDEGYYNACASFG